MNIRIFTILKNALLYDIHFHWGVGAGGEAERERNEILKTPVVKISGWP